jgi:biopolymer transport protein ExbB
MNLESIQHAIAVSGWILYLMAVLLLVALTVVIERSWYLWKLKTQGDRLMTQLKSVRTIGADLVGHLVESNAWLPHAKVLDVALQHDLSHDFERIPDKLEEVIMGEAPGIDRYLWILDTIVTMAPLLGLLGTIIGMFNSFQILGDSNNMPSRVTGGVAEALLATASGLFIAIIGLFFFNALNNRVRVIMHQLETLKVMLINRMYPHYQGTTERQDSGVVTDFRSRAM